MEWNIFDADGRFVGIAHGATIEQAFLYCEEVLKLPPGFSVQPRPLENIGKN